MKKVLLFTAVAVFAGCGKENEDALSLTAPTGLATVTDAANNSATFSWQPVDGADSYELSIEGGNAYTALEASMTIPGFDYDTDYTWKVRAKQKSAYSDWSETATFRIDEPLPFRQKFIGSWGANDAQITFRAKDYQESYDGLLSRSHTARPVTIVVAKDNSSADHVRIVSVSGMDAHITGGTTQSDFSIDSQLAGVQLTLYELAGAIAGSPSISDHNVCKLSPNTKISDIPNYQALLTENASLVADNHIKDIDFKVTGVYLAGTLDGQQHPVFHFTYDIEITRITHDLNAMQIILAKLGGLDTDNLHTLIPQPQQLLSEVAVSD
jgi:hypothetical protein